MKISYRYLSMVVLCACLCMPAFAQQQASSLFKIIPGDTSFGAVLRQKLLLVPEENAIENIFAGKPAVLDLALPVPDGRTLMVHLSAVQLFSENSDIQTSGSKIPYDYQRGVYYRGTIAGASHSLAAVSFFAGSFMAVLSDSAGNYVIGQIKDNDPAHIRYVCYNDRDMLATNPFSCHTPDEDLHNGERTGDPPSMQSGNCIRVYFECDYKMYQDNGSNVSQVMNFVSGMFNVVAALYANESINMTLGTVFVWESQDPFFEFNSTTGLSSFENYRTFFNGDVGMLLTTVPFNLGGLAHISALCSPLKTCYSDIYNSYAALPVYSWTVNVVAHEFGHTLGSRHTHWCGWVGGPIDTCNTCFNLPVEGGNCPNGPVPVNGGTIMSYCHGCGGIGINFSNGFGVQPGNAIRNFVATSSCVSCTICTPPAVPVPLLGSTVAPGTATGVSPNITWNSSAPDHFLNLERFPFGAGDYVNVPTNCIAGNSYAASNLAQGMVYRYEVSGHTGSCNSWCISDRSPAMYFYVPPIINCPSYICAGDSANLSTTDLNGQFVDCSVFYQWYLNGNPVPNANNYNYWATVPGNYYVQLTYSGSNTPNISIASPSCTLVANVPPQQIVISGPDTLCQGYTAVLNVSNPCTGCLYYWVNGPSGTTDYVFNSGTYTVNYYNACGYGSASHHVEFLDFPPSPVITGNSVICPGDTLQLSVSNPCLACNYSWSTGSNTSTTDVTAPGNYYVNVDNSCYTNGSNPFTVTAAVFSITPASQNFGYTGGMDSISVISNSANCTWTATTADSWIHILNSTGTGNGIVYYTVDTCGPGGSGSILVAGQTYVVNQSCLTTGTDEISEDKDFLLFPNPVFEKVVLAANGFSGDCTVRMYDAVGRLILSVPVKATDEKFKIEIPLVDFAAGLYWISVSNKEGCMTKKLVKE